ncbi:Conserved_hypothetical protein [Hexamita inflata]|uniref:Cilia- and flagella-associated protein 263 n=1 Tax=Hexamita inflata TaxID=28002 RepID=A0AA86NUZ6_9EUKA|nr:Conserved hypothetical protein [Hexamita inflata]
MDQSMNISMQQSIQQKASIAQQMDELIQQNELLLKENDYLDSFVIRFKDEEENVPDDVPNTLLNPGNKLAIALLESVALEHEKEQMSKQYLDDTIRQKAMIIASEQRLATLRRLMFQFQREVLQDQQISNTFAENEGGVQQIIHKMPKQVTASSLLQFYEKQTTNLQVVAEQSAKSQKNLQDQIQVARKQSDKNNRQAGLSQIDFEQLKIENDKLQDKVATRNQEMLRIKLSAGNCMRLLNEYKNDLHKICENKKKYDQEVNQKQTLIKQLEERIVVTRKDLDVDNKVLQVLRQKEIFAHDGPQSVDYLSLKVTQTTLEKAVKEMERKIAIKEREINNLKNK